MNFQPANNVSAVPPVNTKIINAVFMLVYKHSL